MSLVFAVVSLTVAIGAIVFSIYVSVTGPQPFVPLDYRNPQHVVNPIVHPGDKLTVEAYKCNTSDKPVAVVPLSIEGNAYIRNVDTNELVPRGGPRIDSAVRQPGCPLLRFSNDLPPLAPGRYLVEGVEIATEGDKFQRAGWSTEVFCLTDADGGGC